MRTRGAFQQINDLVELQEQAHSERRLERWFELLVSLSDAWLKELEELNLAYVTILSERLFIQFQVFCDLFGEAPKLSVQTALDQVFYIQSRYLFTSWMLKGEDGDQPEQVPVDQY